MGTVENVGFMRFPENDPDHSQNLITFFFSQVLSTQKLSAISPCITGLKALYDPIDCTSTGQLSRY